MPRHNRPIPESISVLQAQLEQLRANNPKRTKLPLALWQSAAELARQHGIYLVARSLRLCYTTLKKHAHGCSAPPRSRREKAGTARFVELIGTAQGRVNEYVIEFESDHGSKLRVHCKTAIAPDWAALLNAWRGVER
jgi:hypothetical protein